MTREQKIVAAGALPGVVIMLGLAWMLYRLLPDPAAATLADRLAYALKWQALAALPLLTMIVTIGNARAMSAAIDPTAGNESAGMKINIRVADNTVQQLLLFVAGSMSLAAGIDADRVRVIGAAAIVFVVARIAFWIGYRIDPLYRAAGFAATAYLNVCLIVAALWLALAN